MIITRFATQTAKDLIRKLKGNEPLYAKWVEVIMPN
jgi:hypothetical protein